MSISDSHGLFEQVPDWWSESVLGLAVAFAGVLGMGGGSLVVERLVGLVFGSASSPGSGLNPVLASVVGLLLLVAVEAAVGLGATYAYLTYREFDPGFVLEWPDREAARWLAGLVVLAPILVWAATLLRRLLGSTGAISEWNVPGAFVLPEVVGSVPSPEGTSLLAASGLSIAVLAGVVGPAVAALFHGILQTSLRRVAPTHVAVGGTALAVAVLASGPDPLGSVLVAAVVFAAGYAYERTDNLAVPMVSYAVLNGVTLTTAMVLVLSAAGQF